MIDRGGGGGGGGGVSLCPYRDGCIPDSLHTNRIVSMLSLLVYGKNYLKQESRVNRLIARSVIWQPQGNAVPSPQ